MCTNIIFDDPNPIRIRHGTGSKKHSIIIIIPTDQNEEHFIFTHQFPNDGKLNEKKCFVLLFSYKVYLHIKYIYKKIVILFEKKTFRKQRI